ncbi:MAG: cytochrome c1 [Alphaproteobacteria bacterium]
MKKIIFATFILFLCVESSFSNEHVKHPLEKKWKFDGIFGTIDRAAAQRGYQVYKEVCAACHSMKLVAYRNLATPKGKSEGIGFSEAEVKTLAREYKVKDINDDGEEIERNALPSDRFVSPYANEKAARAANNGAYPPDLSLIIKARENGANYVYSLLTGYGQTPPEGLKVPATQHYNPYYPGGLISMPPPLSEGLVQYSDGTSATVDQMSYDVVNFLHWAAEPEMEARKKMGIKTTLFLTIFTIVFYLAKKTIWARLK